jgi:D-aminopeptidase
MVNSKSHDLGTLLRGFAIVSLFFLCAIAICERQTGARARDLRIPFDGTTGHFNAITDVAGVEVGNTTLISGDGH